MLLGVLCCPHHAVPSTRQALWLLGSSTWLQVFLTCHVMQLWLGG